MEIKYGFCSNGHVGSRNPWIRRQYWDKVGCLIKASAKWANNWKLSGFNYLFKKKTNGVEDHQKGDLWVRSYISVVSSNFHYNPMRHVFPCFFTCGNRWSKKNLARSHSSEESSRMQTLTDCFLPQWTILEKANPCLLVKIIK